jgi:hypothetical protein
MTYTIKLTPLEHRIVEQVGDAQGWAGYYDQFDMNDEDDVRRALEENVFRNDRDAERFDAGDREPFLAKLRKMVTDAQAMKLEARSLTVIAGSFIEADIYQWSADTLAPSSGCSSAEKVATRSLMRKMEAMNPKLVRLTVAGD